MSVNIRKNLLGRLINRYLLVGTARFYLSFPLQYLFIIFAQTEINRSVILYFMLITSLGALGGLIRFNESKNNYTFRTVSISVSIGWMVSFVLIGLLWGNKIIEDPIRCLALSVGIGYVQPNIADYILQLLKYRFNRDTQNDRTKE